MANMAALDNKNISLISHIDGIALANISHWTGIAKGSGPPYTFRYWRLHITKCKVEDGLANGDAHTQFSEFILIDENDDVIVWPSGTSISSPDEGNYISPGSEVIGEAIDNDAGSKWLVFSYSTEPHPRADIDTITGITASGYLMYTGNDSPSRDPSTWAVYGSDDGSSWTLLDTQTIVYITDSRNTATDIYYFP